MKKLFFLLLSLQIAFLSGAQTGAPAADSTKKRVKRTFYSADSVMPKIRVDVHFLAGTLSQDLTAANSLPNYLNAVNSNTGTLKSSNGQSLGFDVEGAYFFGLKQRLGVGIGVMYLSQSADIALEGYHVEFQSKNNYGDVYRQLLTGYNVKESVKMTNVNIPILLKYNMQLRKNWSIAADAGLLVNLSMSNKYTTGASFDYEAIYKFSDPKDPHSAVYDNAPTPSETDLFYTRSHFLTHVHDGDINTYFDNHRAQGENVGLGMKPANKAGTVSYSSGSIGFIVRPSVGYTIGYNVALDLGFYYMFQPFKNDVSNNYQLTNRIGDYNSVLNNVSSAKSTSFGINIGVRYFFGKVKDKDHDGIPDRLDKCPTDSGTALFDGCPDTDGDGIPDKLDACPTKRGIAAFNGCPDTDLDGIPDKDDACPTDKGLAEFHGCPDWDHDGVPDNEDQCPAIAGFIKFHGCPDRDGDGIPDNEDNCIDDAGPISNHGCPDEIKKPIKITQSIDPLPGMKGKSKQKGTHSGHQVDGTSDQDKTNSKQATQTGTGGNTEEEIERDQQRELKLLRESIRRAEQLKLQEYNRQKEQAAQKVPEKQADADKKVEQPKQAEPEKKDKGFRLFKKKKK